jgi:hypothetical protein
MAVAGSIVAAATEIGGGYTKYTLAWVSSAGGAVSEIPVAFKRGHIHRAEFAPDGGATQPSDLYDATLVDAISGGADFLTGVGGNLSNTTRKIAAPQIGDGVTALQRVFHEGGDLYLTVANAGAAKGGTVSIIIGP